MPSGWHPTRWWYWCLSEDKTKGTEPIFTDKIGKCKVNGSSKILLLRIGGIRFERIETFWDKLLCNENLL